MRHECDSGSLSARVRSLKSHEILVLFILLILTGLCIAAVPLIRAGENPLLARESSHPLLDYGGAK